MCSSKRRLATQMQVAKGAKMRAREHEPVFKCRSKVPRAHSCSMIDSFPKKSKLQVPRSLGLNVTTLLSPELNPEPILSL